MQVVAVDFVVPNEVHQFLLYSMFAAVDFIDKEQNRPALAERFVNFPQLVMNGIDRRAVFDCRQAADFPFFQNIPVNIDKTPVVFIGKLGSQGCFADTGFTNQ